MAKTRGTYIDTGTFKNQFTDAKFPVFYMNKMTPIRQKYVPGSKWYYYERVQEIARLWEQRKIKLKILQRYKHFALCEINGQRECFRYVDLEIMGVIRI